MARIDSNPGLIPIQEWAREALAKEAAARKPEAGTTVVPFQAATPPIAPGCYHQSPEFWRASQQPGPAGWKQLIEGTRRACRVDVDSFLPIKVRARSSEQHIQSMNPFDAYKLLLNNPNALLKGSGLQLVPPEALPLESGKRVVLQRDGSPPVGYPFEVTLAGNNELRLIALEGGPLRGSIAVSFGSQVLNDGTSWLYVTSELQHLDPPRPQGDFLEDRLAAGLRDGLAKAKPPKKPAE